MTNDEIVALIRNRFNVSIEQIEQLEKTGGSYEQNRAKEARDRIRRNRLYGIAKEIVATLEREKVNKEEFNYVSNVMNGSIVDSPLVFEKE